MPVVIDTVKHVLVGGFKAFLGALSQEKRTLQQANAALHTRIAHLDLELEKARAEVARLRAFIMKKEAELRHAENEIACAAAKEGAARAQARFAGVHAATTERAASAQAQLQLVRAKEAAMNTEMKVQAAKAEAEAEVKEAKEWMQAAEGKAEETVREAKEAGARREAEIAALKLEVLVLRQEVEELRSGAGGGQRTQEGGEVAAGSKEA